MAAVTWDTTEGNQVLRGVNGRWRTFRGTYAHNSGATQEADTGLTSIVRYWVTNESNANQVPDVDSIVGGVITFQADSFIQADVITVNAEGW